MSRLIQSDGVIQQNGSVLRPYFSTSGGVSDGDKGDITVSGEGTVWTVDNDVVTFAKMQNVAEDRLLGRDTAGSGDVEEISLNASLEFTGTGSIQRSALTGDVTASAGDNSTTIANDAVTNEKLRNSSGFSVIGRNVSSSGDPADIVASATLPSLLAYNLGSNTMSWTEFDADNGLIIKLTGTNNFTNGHILTDNITDDNVTYAKMQNVSAASRLLGRGSAAGAGDPEEITLGTNLSMSGTTLNATGGGGGGGGATTVEVNLGSTARWTGKFTIIDAGISPTSKVLCWQAPGPYTGKGTRADEAELQPVSVISVEPASGSAVVQWQTPPMLTVASVEEPGQRRDVVGATFDRLINQRLPLFLSPRRLGKVRGNVKFSYTVFS